MKILRRKCLQLAALSVVLAGVAIWFPGDDRAVDRGLGGAGVMLRRVLAALIGSRHRGCGSLWRAASPGWRVAIEKIGAGAVGARPAGPGRIDVGELIMVRCPRHADDTPIRAGWAP